MTTQELTSGRLNQRQPNDRELALDELENVSAGRKAGGDSTTSGKEFLRFKFDTVFTT